MLKFHQLIILSICIFGSTFTTPIPELNRPNGERLDMRKVRSYIRNEILKIVQTAIQEEFANVVHDQMVAVVRDFNGVNDTEYSIKTEIDDIFDRGYTAGEKYLNVANATLSLLQDIKLFLPLQEGFDCKVLKDKGYIDGVYAISLNSNKKVWTYCDMQTDGGGWTVIQRRVDDKLSFDRGRSEYVEGFGHPSDNFWIGLNHIYTLTSMKKRELRIELWDSTGKKKYAVYQDFTLDAFYKLNLGRYSGNAGDALTSYNGNLFTTKNDSEYGRSSNTCAQNGAGGWWYPRTCDNKSKLNNDINSGLIWNSKSYVKSTIMIR